MVSNLMSFDDDDDDDDDDDMLDCTLQLARICMIDQLIDNNSIIIIKNL